MKTLLINFKDYAHLSQNLQKVEERLKKSSLNLEQLRSLNAILDQSLVLINSLRQTEGRWGEKSLNDLENHMIALYGDIHNRYFDAEIQSLIEQVCHIKRNLKDPSYLKQSAVKLKNALKLYQENYRGNLKQTKIVQTMELLLKKLTSYLKNQISTKEVALLIEKIEQLDLLPDTAHFSYETAEALIEYFIILDLLEQRKISLALEKFTQLDPETVTVTKDIDQLKTMLWKQIDELAGLNEYVCPELNLLRQAK